MYSFIKKKLDVQARILKSLLGNRNFWVIAGADVVLIVLAHYLAYAIRFEGNLAGWQFKIWSMVPAILLVKMPVFYLCGLYRGMWRYTGLGDIMNIAFASIISSIILVTYVLYSLHFIGYSRSVFVIDALLTFLLIALYRISVRLCSQNGKWLTLKYLFKFATDEKRKKRILLVGAGDAAEKIIREVKDNNELPYVVVGIVDDDGHKVNRKIHGVPVVGLLEDVSAHAKRMRADEILISIASATGEQMKRIVSICQSSGFDFKVLPGLGKIIDGKVLVTTMRKVAYRDLLGRKEVKLDIERIGSYLKDKTVLVTGAGGSIGSELCRQIIRFSPQKILLFDASEENLYSIQMELHHELGFHKYETLLGKVQSSGLLDKVFSQFAPDVVFHAAAYKHVPLLEVNSWEAIYNNIKASKMLLRAAVENKVERFVIVSTDKAVRPTNVMGASKRVTELLMLAYGMDGNCETVFQAVRFGNVLGSSGSVIPLFQKQIEMGGPVTVTHPEVTRFFMSMEEAAQLILQAGAMGTGNEIFVLKMGEPIKIDNMARELIRLAGREPDIEIAIKYTGLRLGEKLYEELITEGEDIMDTDHNEIMVLRSGLVDRKMIFDSVNILIQIAGEQDEGLIKKALSEIVPDYVYC